MPTESTADFPSRVMRALQEKVSGRGEFIARWYLGALFFLLSVYLLSLAVRYTDSDMWYHLAGGRYLFEHQALYNPYFRSYLEPFTDFINYFWGFQAITWLVWVSGGYFGLILMKSMLVLTTAWLMCRILLQNGALRSAGFLQIIVVTACIFLLGQRGLSLRPHLVSFLMITAFIYILLYRRAWFPCLPVLSIVWINVHGIEWVVGALICGAFLVDLLARGSATTDTGWNPDRRRDALWVISCLPVLLLNPSGVAVLETPFLASSEIYRFIRELYPIPFSKALDLGRGLKTETAVVFLMCFWVPGFLCALRRVRANLFPLVLAAGGMILLARGYRFIWEWLLLSTPLLALYLQDSRHRAPGPGQTAVLMVVLLLVSRAWWIPVAGSIHRYPFDDSGLPGASTKFVAKYFSDARYSALPSYAGYLEWVLDDSIRIQMDMQFPPFTEMELLEYQLSRTSPAGLARHLDKYHPDLLAVKRKAKGFSRIIRTRNDYVPVFFDDVSVLYVDRNSRPEIAATFGLKSFDPFDPDRMRANEIISGIRELKRILEVSVDNRAALSALTGFLVQTGRFEEAAEYLEPGLERFPADGSLLFLNARIAHQTGHCDKAVPTYEHLASRKGDEDGASSIHVYAGECYFLLGNHHKAYEHFMQGVDLYHADPVNLLTYYQFALSAYVLGETETARRLLWVFEALDDGRDDALTASVARLKASVMDEDQ